MRDLRRVVWSRGMFLTPQHFQAADNWVENSLQFRFRASEFANWGAIELRTDEEALANGLLSLRRFSGILPDGTPVSVPDADPLPGGRQIAGHFPPSQEALDVFLALPERHEGGKNFRQRTEQNSEASTARYTADTLEIVDENGYGEGKAVQLATRNLRLLFGSESLDGFVAQRIARIVRDQAGLYILDPQFIAPCLNIASSEYLMNLLRRQIEVLISKAESLGSRGASLSFNATEAVAFWLLHTINSYVPELQHIWNVRHGHPEPVWVTLLSLAGSLSTFSPEGKAGELPRYDHDNLGPCFTALSEKIRELLDVLIKPNCISIPLRLVEKSIWTGTVTNDEYLKGTFFLVLSSRISVDQLISKVPERVKIADPNELQDLIRLALPGLALRHTQNLPGAITFKMNNQYFTISQTGRVWDRVMQSRNIGVFIPPDIAEAQPEVLVVLQSKEGA
ncbi:MAG: type VI secretion system baseplate subunit TssK [Acidobacteriia bacterium]|nr:type VI secretion system baseplate subunit TssK [Terriglobia bacterium]